MSEDEPRPNANAEVARLLAEIGDILELKGEQPYRYNAYRTAARSVGGARERLDALFQEGRLRELHGVGSAIEAKIIEYLGTGQMEYYERVRREFPPALASLLQVPGLGPGKARALYQELGVSSTAELEEAARSGRLKDVPGFGDKVAETVLEVWRSSRNVPIATCSPMAGWPRPKSSTRSAIRPTTTASPSSAVPAACATLSTDSTSWPRATKARTANGCCRAW